MTDTPDKNDSYGDDPMLPKTKHRAPAQKYAWVKMTNTQIKMVQCSTSATDGHINPNPVDRR